MLPHTDWLHHDLVVSGPAEDVAVLRKAARGSGGIPWETADAELIEEDRVLALIRPPDGSHGLDPAAARVLARRLRAAAEAHHQRVVAAVGRSTACPFDLHALFPLPAALLRRGPDDPRTRAWLLRHWGTTRALRHVRLVAGDPDRRLRRSARVEYAFWSADWSPWPALAALRLRFPALVLDLRPAYLTGCADV